MNWIKYHWKFLLVMSGGALAVGFAIQSYVSPEKQTYESHIVASHNLIYDVALTGTVIPSDKVDLGFEESGKIDRIDVNVSDVVKQGDILAQLKNKEVSAALDEARKQVESGYAQLEQFRAEAQTENFTLTEIQKGTREEELQIAKTKVISAQKELEEAKTQLEKVTQQTNNALQNLYVTVSDVVQSGYTKGYDAVFTQAGRVFDNEVTDPQINFVTTKNQSEINAENQFEQAAKALENYQSLLNGSTGESEMIISNARASLLEIRSFLTTVTDALNFSANLSGEQLSTYKTAINTAWTNVNTSIADMTDLLNAIQQKKKDNEQIVSKAQLDVVNKETAYSVAQDELALKQAGATQETIDIQKQRIVEKQFKIQSQLANISALQSKVNQIGSQLEEYVIIAPFDGVVTRQDKTVGEVIAAHTPFISLISDQSFEVEVFVPEVEIALLSVGNQATITLDAYGANIPFSATVMQIDPAETIKNGVSTYKVTLLLDTADTRIKSGMTANVVIHVESDEPQVALPLQAISQSFRKKVEVFVVTKEGREKREITIGRISSNGYVEVLAGLQEGETVLIPVL